jgi:WD40 repeat protein
MAVISADGKNILSASGDRTLVWWEVETGRAIRRMSGHSDGVSGCALFPDGCHAISSSIDRTLIIWNLETGKAVRRLEGHKDYVNAVVMSCKGDIAVSASADGTLMVWDVASGRRLRTLDGRQSRVTCLAISPDGRTAISGSTDKKLTIWDLKSGGTIGQLAGGFTTPEKGDTFQLFLSHDEPVTGVAWSVEANRVVSSSEKSLIIWDLASCKPIRKISDHGDWINCVWMSSGGERVVSGGWGSIIIWDVERGAEIRRFKQSGVGSVQCSPDGKILVSAASDQTVTLWNLAETRQHHAYGHSRWVSALGISANGMCAISGSDDEKLIVWDASSGEPLGKLPKIGEGNTAVLRALSRLRGVHDQASSPHGGKAVQTSVACLTGDGRRAVSADWGFIAMSWDVETTRLLGQFGYGSDWPERRYLIAAGALSDNGERAILAGNDVLSVWRLEHKIGDREVTLGHLVTSFKDPAGDLSAVALTPGGGHAMTGSETGGMTLWDIERRRMVRSSKAHGEKIAALALSRDGRRALTGSWDTTLKCWDVESGQSIQMFVGHRLPVVGVAFLADENLVASASYDRNIIIWDIRTGASVARLLTRSAVFSLAVAGNRLLCGDADGSVHFLEAIGMHSKPKV